MKNAVNWFEIPVKNFDDSKSFYETIMDAKMETTEMGDSVMAFFPSDGQSGGIGGSIITGQGYEPSQSGSLVYLNGGEDLSVPLARVEKAGGKVLVPKTHIGENGYIAHFLDPEGNRVAFHSFN